ncbi:MAG TPA: carboxypeptidase-like regulatory domain-containing protein, partial [Vicinamibacterales bacterium]
MAAPVVRRLLAVCAILAMPVAGFAQEAILSGNVTDSTGGVLPGVTVTAVHEATGNTFVAVTNERGTFRIGARVGTFRLTFELPGFTTITQSGLELLVGQTADLRVQMSVTSLQETVTVTAEAPLLDTTGSSLGGNIDPRQMSELPVQGRSWTALALLAPGNRTTAMGAAGTVPQPVEDREDVRDFHVNMDGVQVTSMMGPGGQPRLSRDVIAEFQFISNRYDATQGRSAGAQVNAITRSGTNTFAGSFGGYFRSSSWNAEDPVLRRVVPYEDQQYSTTFGGPILRDRLHFFGNYEYEREPRTQFANTGFPRFDIALTGTNTVNMGGTRFDYQLSPQNRLMAKWYLTKFQQAFANLGSNHPQ